MTAARTPTPARTFWPYYPSKPTQARQQAAQLQAMQRGELARWPAGCTHLQGAAR